MPKPYPFSASDNPLWKYLSSAYLQHRFLKWLMARLFTIWGYIDFKGIKMKKISEFNPVLRATGH